MFDGDLRGRGRCSSAERREVTCAASSVAGTLSSDGLDLRFPGEIFVVETSGKEEAGAAHTRSNSIVLPKTTWLKKGE